METKNKNLKFVVFIIAAFILGYLIYPQINRKHMPTGMHKIPDGSMMMDMNSNMHQNMSMGNMMKAMTKSLEGKTDKEFDSAFLEEMIPHHLGAIEMAQMVLKSSNSPELKKLANDIISAQQKEIDMMRKWQKEWFGLKSQ